MSYTVFDNDHPCIIITICFCRHKDVKVIFLTATPSPAMHHIGYSCKKTHFFKYFSNI